MSSWHERGNFTFTFTQPASRSKRGTSDVNYGIFYERLASRTIFLEYPDFRGLGVACWPLVPKFAGSNPAEAVGFLRAKKSSARLPSEGK